MIGYKSVLDYFPEDDGTYLGIERDRGYLEIRQTKAGIVVSFEDGSYILQEGYEYDCNHPLDGALTLALNSIKDEHSKAELYDRDTVSVDDFELTRVQGGGYYLEFKNKRLGAKIARLNIETDSSHKDWLSAYVETPFQKWTAFGEPKTKQEAHYIMVEIINQWISEGLVIQDYL